MTRQNVGDRPRDREEANPHPPAGKSAGASVRIAYALFAGAAVSATAYLCAWQQLRGETRLRPPIAQEEMSLGRLQLRIDGFQEQHQRLPEHLSEVISADDLFQLTSSGDVTDDAGFVYQYRRSPDGYELWSLGADGRPGGIGLDADWYADGRNRESLRMTLRQFSTAESTVNVWDEAILAGVLTFAACLVLNLIGPRVAAVVGLPRPTMHGHFLAEVALATVMAAVAACFMSWIHIPSGH